MSSVEARINALIKEYTVFVVSKGSCPFCRTGKYELFCTQNLTRMIN